MRTSVYRARSGQRAEDVCSALAAVELSIDQRRRVRRTLLDTFDRRLRAAGLVLELVEEGGGTSRLRLSGDGAPVAATAVPAPPTFAADLPAGPFRSRLAGVVDCRALGPVLVLDGEETTLTRRNRDGKAVVSVRVSTGVGAPHPVVEVDELAGYARPAGRARDALVRLGLGPAPGTVYDLVAAETGADIGRKAPGPTVPLDPAAPARAAYGAVLANLASAVDANWQGTVDDIDPEFLHDLRVAVRRARVVLGEAAGALEPELRRWARDELRWLAGGTGPARDLDVLSLEWDSYVAGLGAVNGEALAPLRGEVEARRRDAHTALAAALRSPRFAAVMERWRTELAGEETAATEGGGGPVAGRPIGSVVAERLRRAQRRLLARGRSISDATPAEELHELRKDAKRLRYLLECFGGVLPAPPRKAFVQRLKVLQDNLGEHQDTEVHAIELARLGEGRLDGPSLVTLGRVVAQLENRQRDARRQFAAAFAGYDSPGTRRLLSELRRAAARPGKADTRR